VFLNGCTYGAWGGSAKFLRDCIGSGNDLKTSIEGAESNSTLVFRVNRDVVVLNDTASGAAWMATDNLQRVDNWQDIVPPEGDAEQQDETTDDQVETTPAQAHPENTPPVAHDEFGVRPGRTTMLPVLDNDTDADGDVLVASLAQEQPRSARCSRSTTAARCDRGAGGRDRIRLVPVPGRRRPRRLETTTSRSACTTGA
jgi:hypothetical protein